MSSLEKNLLEDVGDDGQDENERNDGEALDGCFGQHDLGDGQ